MATNKYRTATQTRRGVRSGLAEHDDFEGLPVRQWRQEWVNIAPTSPAESTQPNDPFANDLPYGMPKDTPLLPPHSQELLHAARSGRLYKRPTPAEEDDPEPDAAETKGDKKDSDVVEKGFMVKTWKQIPRNVEGPAVSHLAKRHKNTVTLPSKATMATHIVGSGLTATRHTVRRIDAAGNPYEQTVTVADGQKVDGEIISTTIVPLQSANSEQLAQQQATPVRRRPPPPKRKAKGPGRGRKKAKLPLPLPSGAAPAGGQHVAAENGVAAVKTEGANSDVSNVAAGSTCFTVADHEQEQAVKIEDNEDSANHDSEMADNSAMQSEDEEGDEGDEAEDEAERGAEEGSADRDVEETQTPEVESRNEQDHDQDVEMEDSESSEVIRPSSIEEPDEPRRSTSEEEYTVPKARFQAPPSLGNLGPPLGATHLVSPRLEGSPLKNVIVQSPTDQSPMVSPHGASGASGLFAAATSFAEIAASIPKESDGAENTAGAAVGLLLVTVSDTALEGATVSDGLTGLGSSEAVDSAMDFSTDADKTAAVQAPDSATVPEPLKTGSLPGEPTVDDAQNPVAASDVGVPEAPDAMQADQQQPPRPPAEGISAQTSLQEPQPTPSVEEAQKQTTINNEEKERKLASTMTDVAVKSEAAVAESEVFERREPPDSPALLPTAAAEDEDDGLNLLGSLERELDRQEGVSRAPSTGSGRSGVEQQETTAAAGTAQKPEAAAAAITSDVATVVSAPADTNVGTGGIEAAVADDAAGADANNVLAEAAAAASPSAADGDVEMADLPPAVDAPPSVTAASASDTAAADGASVAQPVDQKNEDAASEDKGAEAAGGSGVAMEATDMTGGAIPE
ncbi:hypothetical protein B0H66DRAFT_528378 [Apodospora peruviana]|uniref:Apopolysialoglycoprotein n=1 Tax=Apodospora peruviana TaxID=516989 RepID=A0AAE0ITN1_9PEZI|nr:hypothetical protein B0H66DRAFT_528378 [Apodospora peruviana]